MRFDVAGLTTRKNGPIYVTRKFVDWRFEGREQILFMQKLFRKKWRSRMATALAVLVLSTYAAPYAHAVGNAHLGGAELTFVRSDKAGTDHNQANHVDTENCHESACHFGAYLQNFFIPFAFPDRPSLVRSSLVTSGAGSSPPYRPPILIHWS